MDSRRLRNGRGRRSASHGSPGGASGAFAMADWDASTALATASGSGIAGDAVAGVAIVIAYYLRAVPSAVNIVTRRNSGNSGWSCRVNSASFQWVCGNGAASVFSPTKTLVAGDVGKIHVAAMSSDISVVKHYHDSAQVGTSTVLVGYAAAAINNTMGSAENGTSPALDFSILGVAGRDSALTLADFQTICTATKAAGSLALGGISMAHQWNAPAASAMPATLSDSIGSDNMTFIVGAAANVNIVRVPKVWAF